MSRKSGLPCLGCNRAGGILLTLASGRQALVCKICQEDRFQMQAAERKAKARDEEEAKE